MPSDHVGTRELAEWLGCTDRAVRDYARRGVIAAAGRGRWPLRASVGAVVEHLRAQAAGRAGDGPLDLAQERARLSRTQREKLEIDICQRRGELVEAAAVERDAYKTARATRDRLLNVPDRVATLIAAETDPAAVHTLLSTEIRLALQDCIRVLSEATDEGAPDGR